MCHFSNLVICHMSKPRYLDMFLRMRQEDPWSLHVVAQLNPSWSRNAKRTMKGWTDYKNAATVREMTQGEG